MDSGSHNSQRKATARGHIVATLTQEILNHPKATLFPIGTERQLAIRFNVSRVTIRYALADLEHRGLICRRHGSGTFAYGQATRGHRNIALFFKLAESIHQKMMLELIQGAQTVITSIRSALILTSVPPMEWRADMASSLGGVIIIPEEVTFRELAVLRDRKLPFVSIGKSHLPKPRLIPLEAASFYQIGQQAATLLSQSALTGKSVVGQLDS